MKIVLTDEEFKYLYHQKPEPTIHRVGVEWVCALCGRKSVVDSFYKWHKCRKTDLI
jgi:hypothetical protein